LPQAEWREDLKGLYRQAGIAAKPSAFLFDETQIKFESFLTDVHNILTSGEVCFKTNVASGTDSKRQSAGDQCS